MIQCCPAHFSASVLHSPPRDMRSNYFVNKIFVISRLITKFTKILCHENLELHVYGTSQTLLSLSQLDPEQKTSYISSIALRPHLNSYLFSVVRASH